MTKSEQKFVIEEIFEMSEYVWNVDEYIPDSIKTFAIYNAILLLDKIKHVQPFDVTPLPRCNSLEFEWVKGNKYVSVEISEDSLFVFRKDGEMHEGFDCSLDDISGLLDFIDWIEHD